MKFLLPIFLVSFCLLPVNGFCMDDPGDISIWLKLLETGNEREKKLALERLPGGLRYPAIQDRTVFDPVLGILQDKNPSLRAAAAAALKEFGRMHPGFLEEKKYIAALRQNQGRYGPPKKQMAESLAFHEARNLIGPPLVKALTDPDSSVRQEIAKAFSYFKFEDGNDELIKALNDRDPWVRVSVAFALGEMKALKALDALLQLLEDDSDWRNKFVQRECLRAIMKIGLPDQIAIARPSGKVTIIGKRYDAAMVGKIIPFLMRKSDDPYLRQMVLTALGHFEAVEAKEILLRAKDDPDPSVRRLAIWALLRVSTKDRKETPIKMSQDEKYSEEMLAFLKQSAKDPSAMIRAEAVEALGRSGDQRPVDLLLEALRDSDHSVRKNAIIGLAGLRDERVLDSMLLFFGKRDSSTHEIGKLAEDIFMSVVRKTSEGQVVVCRREGLGNVTKNALDDIEKTKCTQRNVHPSAVGKLIDFLHRGNVDGKSAALSIFPQFEDPRLPNVLLDLLDDPSPEIRRRAVSRLPAFFDNTIVPRLIEISKHPEPKIREEAVNALRQYYDDPRTLEPLVERVKDQNEEVRAAALRSLKGREHPAISGLVIPLLKDKSASVRSSALANIIERKDRRAIDALIELLNDTGAGLASRAAEALGIIGDKKAVLPLIRAAKGEFAQGRQFGADPDVQRKALRSLGLLGGREALPVLLSALKDKELKLDAVVGLAILKAPESVPALIGCLSDEELQVSYRAASALREIGDPAGLEALKDKPELRARPSTRNVLPRAPSRPVLPPPPGTIPAPGDRTIFR